MSARKVVVAVLAAVVVAGTLGGRAQAHHSRAAYDNQNLATLSGTVKDFKYTNPHTWIYLMVPDGKGGESQWSLEGGTVNMLVRQGWTSKTLLPGMKIKVLIAPRKDGANGGEWMSLLEIDGRPFSSP